MAVIDQSWLLIGPPATHLLVTGHGVMAEVGAPGDELRGVRGDPEHILHSDWLAGSCLLIGQWPRHWPLICQILSSDVDLDLWGCKAFETDLLLLCPELHKALNNKGVRG